MGTLDANVKRKDNKKISIHSKYLYHQQFMVTFEEALICKLPSSSASTTIFK
jgi:hypothetical protein